MVTLADGDEVLGAQPDTVEQRQPVGGGPGRRQGCGRGGGEGEDQLCLGGGLRGGEAGERGWRALEGAERLAGVQRDPGGLDLGGAAGGFLQDGQASLLGIEPAGEVALRGLIAACQGGDLRLQGREIGQSPAAPAR